MDDIYDSTTFYSERIKKISAKKMKNKFKASKQCFHLVSKPILLDHIKMIWSRKKKKTLGRLYQQGYNNKVKDFIFPFKTIFVKTKKQ